VKSTTDVNAEKQLRLGLGQVLRYADHYERGATPVLVAEHAPTDKTWYRTCARVGVILTDPASFPALLSTMREGVELPMKP